jgi:thiamine biosynthesis lipoprotein
MMSAAMRRVLVPLSLPVTTCPQGDVHTLRGTTMGTTWSVQLVAAHDQLPALSRVIQMALDDVVGQMSHWEASSDLSRFNRAPPGAWQVLPDAFFTVLDCALALARDSEGAYDPTIGKLVDLWGFGPQATKRPVSTPPAFDAVEQTRRTSGWQTIQLDYANRRAQQPGGVSLDFSSIAKGFGVDHAALALERVGVSSYLLEVGGELRGLGVRSDGTPWWVEMERPPATSSTSMPQSSDCVSASLKRNATPLTDDDVPLDIVALHGLSVATSGDYRRYFEHNGKRYAHTLDPRTGYPVEHTASVTVLHSSCMVADALATLLTVLGPDAAPQYAERCNIAARMLFSSRDGMCESCSPAFLAMLS